MKIYFAGPLFTPYVRAFISKHAQILRDNGIDPFVPHEKFNSFITPARVDSLVESGLLQRDELPEKFDPDAVMGLVRAGRITREQLGLPPMTPQVIFDTDYEGLASANAVVAILDGTQVDDGTACEIGIFYALTRRDPARKGIVGLMTDLRGLRKKDRGYGVNLFVLGAIEECGKVTDSFDEVIQQLKTWEAELKES